MNQKNSVAFYQQGDGGSPVIVSITANSARKERQAAREKKAGLRLLDAVEFVRRHPSNGGRSNERLGQLLSDIEGNDPELYADVCDLVACVYAVGRRGRRFKRTRR